MNNPTQLIIKIALPVVIGIALLVSVSPSVHKIINASERETALRLVTTTRTYWPIDPATYAVSGSKHSHITVTGFVTYVSKETDGDIHIRICDSALVLGMDTKHCIIAECIPELPCAHPAIGSSITVSGISRQDPEHDWYEIHPVESIK